MNHIRRYKAVDESTRTAAVEQAEELIRQGMSRTAAARAVAPAFGVHANTVANWLREAAEAVPPTSVHELQAKVNTLRIERDSLQALVRRLTGGRGTEPGQDLP